MRRLAVNGSMMLLLACCSHLVYMPPYHFTSAATNELETNHLTDLSETERTMSRAATGDTTEHESITTRVDERIVGDPRGPMFLRVTTGHYSGGDYYDSIFVRRADLTPVREHLAYLQRHIDKRFEFGGTSIHQTNVIGDSTRTFDTEYTLPVYAFSEVELIIRSLPFHSYYSAVIPLYSEGDDKLEMDSVYVVNDRPPGRRWTVRFSDPAIVAVYGIDASTRRILSYYVTSRKTNGRAYKIYAPAFVHERPNILP